MFLKIGWRRKSSSDKNALLEVDNDDGLRVGRSEKRLSLLSIPSGLVNTDIFERSRSRSNERSPQLPRATSPNDLRIEHHEKGPLFGLHLVSDNPKPSGDIIFVHGLGGHARTTWCWDRDPEQFWPKWLASDEDLLSYRMFTFGYNSDFSGVDTNLSIVDFAKDLLFQMLTFTDGTGVRIGERPIVFVCHSLGGIVAKKAYILGKHNPDFAHIVAQVYGMLFLGTPHRGAHHVKTLDLILSKSYVADLDTQSTVLQDVNEQFRTACEGLKLFSFFETQKTRVGLAKYWIVEKQSATMGYPEEISCDLNADHHNMCKFKSVGDGNFIKVRNTLKRCASMISSERLVSLSQESEIGLDSTSQIAAVLDVQEPADEALNLIRHKTMRGTCQWILNRSDFVDWIERPAKAPNPQTFCLFGLPATGKTAIASTVIDRIQAMGQKCQYHFFFAGHQIKRNAAYCLRSIAAQLASSDAEFRERLLNRYKSTGTNLNFDKQSFEMLWENVFEGIIFKMKFSAPLFWVFDAIDEVDSTQRLLSHLLKIHSETPIKLFFTSRPISIPSAAVASYSSFSLFFLSEEHTNDDMRAFVQATVQDALPSDEALQTYVTSQILRKSSGSFLWAKLVIEMLQDHWHTQDDIQEILNGVPEGMDFLYSRMLEKVKRQPLRLQLIAKRILTWAACSWTPLHIDELRIALEPEFNRFPCLKDTILQICGHFVSVDHDKVSLVHITARRFLLEDRDGGPAFINESLGHEHVALTCLKFLSNDSWRHTFKTAHISCRTLGATKSQNPLMAVDSRRPFTIYSSCHWAYHISKSPVDSNGLRKVLQSFLSRYCLSWIEAVALSKDLHHLTRSAKYLKIYGKRLRNMRLHSTDPPLSLKLPTEDFGQDIQAWSTDFIRIVGKFGPNIVQYPSSIHRLVPPFCPRNSMVAKFYSSNSEQMMSVSGLHCSGWDDCLTTVSVGEDVIASRVLATNTYFFVLISGSGTIIVWHAETCEEARRIEHEEYLLHVVLNRSGNLIATAGVESYRVWDVESGQELHRFPKTRESITMAIAFGNGDSELILGYDDCSITCYDLDSHEESWCFSAVDPSEEFSGCPRLMSFSPDLTKVAVAWRGKPLLVWDMTETEHRKPKRCRVAHSTDSMCAPEAVIWQSNGDSILVLCQNAMLVEWRLYDDEKIEFPHVTARNITTSPDGNFLLTSDSLGTMSVWAFPQLNLVYQLTSTDGFIRDLAFSPDGQRFYDTRQATCNVWEPDVLVRPDESDLQDHSSVDGLSVVTDPVISHDEFGQVSITALDPSSDGNYYCCGREDGSVTIHEAIEGKKARNVYSHTSSSSIIALKWSSKGRYMVSADDSGRVILKRLEVKGPGKWSVFPVLDIRLHEPVEQFLFQETERLLLISSSSTDVVWDLKVKKELCRLQWETRQRRRWIEHPGNSEQIIWVDPVEIRTYNWTTLSRNDTSDSSYAENVSVLVNKLDQSIIADGKSLNTNEMSVQSVTLTGDKRQILYEIVPVNGYARSVSSAGQHLESISTSDLGIERAHGFARNCPTALAGQVKRLVGTYQDQIVFLDHDYWLCTWKFKTDFHTIQRHFFLPRDWLNHETLSMAVIDAQGTFLCPKHGCVAIVRNGVKI